jgi:hypothetical protein
MVQRKNSNTAASSPITVEDMVPDSSSPNAASSRVSRTDKFNEIINAHKARRRTSAKFEGLRFF